MATELSEQVSAHLAEGQYAEAIRAITRAWNESGEFGVRHCPLPEYTETWVKFKTRGYPFGLRQKWTDARTYETTLAIVLPYIVDWNFVSVTSGQPIALPEGERSIALVDDIEDALLMWLIREFGSFWLGELTQPRKNF